MGQRSVTLFSEIAATSQSPALREFFYAYFLAGAEGVRLENRYIMSHRYNSAG